MGYNGIRPVSGRYATGMLSCFHVDFGKNWHLVRKILDLPLVQIGLTFHDLVTQNRQYSGLFC